MVDLHQKTIVGVFALAGLILLGIMVLMFGGGRTLFANTYNVDVHFPKGVVGVASGQSVTLNGKRIGQTTGVEFWRPDALQKGVRVIVAVEKQYALPASSHVKVSASIMGFGRPAILIVVDNPNDATQLPRDGTAEIEGEMIPTLDQVVPPEMQQTLVKTADHLGDLAAALKPVAANLQLLLEPRNVREVDLAETTANISTLIERLDKAVKNFNWLVGDADNQANFKQLIANSKTMSEHGIQAVQNVNQLAIQGQKVAEDTGKLVRRLGQSADQISAVLTRMDQTLATLNSGKGSVGLMLNDKRLYEELLLSARRLSKMLDDVREVMDIVKKGELKLQVKGSPF